MNEGTGNAAGVASQAVGVAHEVETNLGVVGVLVLVIIGICTGWFLTVRWAKQVSMATATELGKWVPHMASVVRRSRSGEDVQRRTLTKIEEVDQKLDERLPDAPRSRRGDR